MIVGKGLLGRSLENYDHDDCVFIASGVSDSKCSDISEFNREKKLVTEIVRKYPGKIVIFFSTFSINDAVLNHDMYVEHKLLLEKLIETNCDEFLIARVSNLVGRGGNPKTVFNFFLSSILGGKQFSLWPNSVRNLIMDQDFAQILNFILVNEWQTWKNSIVNIVNARSYTAGEIVLAIEEFTGIRADYKIVDIKSSPTFEDAHATYLFRKLGIDTTNYIQRILNTYHSEHKTSDIADSKIISKL